MSASGTATYSTSERAGRSPATAFGGTLRADEEKSRATGSAAGATSDAQSESNGSEEWGMETQLPGDLPGRQGTKTMDQTFEDLNSAANIRALIARLEDLQACPSLKSPQAHPSSRRYLHQRRTGMHPKDGVSTTLDQHQNMTKIDQLINEAIKHNPEQRMRIAAMTRSGWLRQKILGAQPKGARGAGSSTLGGEHPWRQGSERKAMHFSDCNWPKVAVNPHDHHSLPGSFLPGGDSRHDRLLRCPVDKLPIHPAQTLQPDYSIPREKRWWGCKENGELDKHFQQKRLPPGPGAYHKSAPRGPHFSVDAGETVVLGANHPFPWKSPLGNTLNPSNVHVLSEHHSAPKYSFSKTRRSVSETHLGHGASGGLIKSDEGCLSPGHVYELYSTFSAGPGLKGKRKKTRSSSSGHLPRMRMVCVPPEPEAGGAAAGDDDEFGPPGVF